MCALCGLITGGICAEGEEIYGYGFVVLGEMGDLLIRGWCWLGWARGG